VSICRILGALVAFAALALAQAPDGDAQTQPNSPRESLRRSEADYQRALRDGNLDAQAQAWNNIGIAHYYLGEYAEALDSYRNCLAIAERRGDELRVADALNNMGIIHYYWGQYQQTLDCYARVLEIRRRRGDRRGVAETQNNFGNLYYATGRNEEALAYFADALTIYRELGLRALEASVLNNSGLALYRQQRFDEALQRFEQALAIERTIDDKAGLAFSLNNVGMALSSLGERQRAREHYQQSLALRQEIGDQPGTAITMRNLAGLHDADGDTDRALELLMRALTIAREIGVMEAERDILDSLAKVHERVGSYEQALAFQKQLTAVRSKLIDDTTAKRLADQEALHGVEKKDRELKVLRAEQQRDSVIRNFAIGGSVLLVLLVALLVRMNRLKDRASREMKTAHDALSDAQSAREQALRAEISHLTRFATLGELAAGLTHELRTPLMGLSLNATATRKMVSSSADEEELKAALEDIVSGARTAHEIIKRLRKLIRHGGIRRDRAKINELVRGLEPVARNDANERGVQLILELAPSDPVFTGDGLQIQQALLNLVHNGIEACAGSDGAVVTVTTADDDESTTITVSDTGPPIDEQALQRIFEPFYTTKSDGMGMGLRITKTIVDAHGGSLDVRRNPERGISVALSLPKSGPTDNPPDEPQPEAILQP